MLHGKTEDTYFTIKEKNNVGIVAVSNKRKYKKEIVAIHNAANVALDVQRAYEDRLATLKHRQKEKKG